MERVERLGLEPIDPDASVVALMFLADEARHAQDAQVAAHGRRAQAERLGELTGAARSLAQQLDGAAPRRIGERRQRAIEIAHAFAFGSRSRWENHQW